MKQLLWQRFWSIAGAVNIRWKIMGIVVAVILILGASITYHLATDYRGALRAQIEEQGVAMGRSLAARSANLLLTSQRFALFELAKETQESGRDIQYVYITESSGEPLVHTFSQGFPRGLLGLPAPQDGEAFRVTRLATEAGVVQDIAVPILGGRGGVAHVGMSEARVQGYVEENIRTSVLIIGAVLLFGVLGAYVLATVLTRPVKQLVEATEAVGSGDFSKAAPVWASDEIGQLGIAFNQMAGQLRQSSEALLARNRDLEALNVVASTANRSQDAKVVMQVALDEVLGLSGADAAWVSLLDEENDRLSLAAERGLSGALLSAAGSMDSSGCPCMATSFVPGQEREVRVDCRSLLALFPATRDRSPAVCVPLRSQGRPMGALQVVYPPGSRVEDRERQLLLAIGDQVGVALENARLLTELRRKEAVRGQLLEKVMTAQEDERKRIARELHDETSQALASLAVTLRSIEGYPLTDEQRDRLAQVQTMATAALRGIHDLAFQLRPSVLDEAGLAPAIERYLRGFTERYGVPVDTQVVGMRHRLPSAIETALYRITQEALTNVARHAQASQVSVLVERRNGSVLLLIEDNGRGFSMSESRENPERLGIHGMEERAILVGGRCTIESQPGRGTSVYVEVPAPGESDE